MGRYESAFWLSDGWGASRRERASGTYRPYVPDPIAGADIRLTAEAAAAAAAAERAVAALNERGAHLRDTEPLARLVLRSEAIASSRIEGLEVGAGRLLEYEALRSMGVPQRPDRAEAAVLANVAAMRGGVEAMASGGITVDAIREVNRRLLEGSALEAHGGRLRDRQNWVGGNRVNPVGAAYVPPRPELVPALMDDLAAFAEGSPLPACAVAAVAHAQLETVHPFADGNGRTGRALVHAVLRRRGVAPSVVPPVSLVLATDRDRYIANLVAYRTDEDDPSSPGLDDAASDWVEYFCSALVEACRRADGFERTLEGVLGAWRERVRPRSGSAADLLLGALVDEPVVSVATAARMVGRSREAARLAVARLVEAGVLVQSSRNRKSGIYVARDVVDAFTGYERSLASPSGDTSLDGPVRRVPQRPPWRR